MRRVRYSATFIHQFNTLLAQGEAKFGARVVDRKRDLVYDTIDGHLAQFPQKRRDPDIELYTHAITCTPFVVIYDFDDTELRVFFIVHGHTDRARIDPAGGSGSIGGMAHTRGGRANVVRLWQLVLAAVPRRHIVKKNWLTRNRGVPNWPFSVKNCLFSGFQNYQLNIVSLP